jgi:hypothetical protein
MDKQQTALDYYSKQIGKLTADLVTNRITGKQFVMLEIKLHSEAKEMEKQQIIDACWAGGDDGEQYYEQTYGADK